MGRTCGHLLRVSIFLRGKIMDQEERPKEEKKGIKYFLMAVVIVPIVTVIVQNFTGVVSYFMGIDRDKWERVEQAAYESLPEYSVMREDRPIVFNAIYYRYVLEDKAGNQLNVNGRITAFFQVSYQEEIVAQVGISGFFYDQGAIAQEAGSDRIVLYGKSTDIASNLFEEMKEDVFQRLESVEGFEKEHLEIRLLALLDMEFSRAKNETKRGQYIVNPGDALGCERLKEDEKIYVDSYFFPYGMSYEEEEYQRILGDICGKIGDILD